MRFDLTVNILTNHAVNRGLIVVFGGAEKRTNIHIDYVTDLYREMLAFQDKRMKWSRAKFSRREMRALIAEVIGKNYTCEP